MLKRKIMLVGFFALCLLHTVYIGVAGILPYDPWSDINDDGIIDVEDLTQVSLRLWEEGTPINKAAVQFEGNISVPAAAFSPGNDGYDWLNIGHSLFNLETTGLYSKWFAQVQLPHGANITNLTSYWYDNNASFGVDCWLMRQNQGAIHVVASALPPGAYMPEYGSYEAPSISHPTVDNNNWAYFLQVNVPRPSSDFFFQYAVIEWEY